MKIKILKTSCFQHNGAHTVYNAGEVHDMDEVLTGKALASGYCKLVNVKDELEREKQRLKAEKDAQAKAKSEAEAAELAELVAAEAAEKEKMLADNLKNKMLESEQNK